MYIVLLLLIGLGSNAPIWHMTDLPKSVYVVHQGYWRTRKDAKGVVLSREYTYKQN